MVDDFEEIKKLPPDERMRKLKELQKKRQKEIEEADKLFRESAREKDERERVEFLEDEAEESLEEGLAAVPEDLESTVTNEPVRQQEIEQIQQSYINELARRPIYELHSQAQELAQNIGYEQIEDVAQLSYAVAQKEKDIEEGAYSATDRVVNEISTTKKILDEVMGAYKR